MKKALLVMAVVLAILLAMGVALYLVLRGPVEQFLGRGYAGIGDRFEREGNYEQARQMYDKAIACDPDSAKYFFHRAAIGYRMGNYRESVADSGRGIDLDAKDSVGWAWRGYAENQLGQLKPAYDDMSRALELSAQNTGYLLERAEILEKLDDFPAALADVDRVLKLFPKDAKAYARRAVIDENMGDEAKAMADVDEAERLAPGTAQVRLHRGWLLVGQGNYDAALDEVRKATAESSHDPDALFLLGVIQERTGQPEPAKATFDQLLELAPKYNARVERGIAEYDLSQLDAARADFDAAKDRVDARGKARLWLWVVDNELGHVDEADRDLVAWVDGTNSPGSEERRSIAEVVLGRKTPQDFEAFVTAVASPFWRQQFKGELWFFTAKAALFKGDSATALADFQRTIDSKATSIDEYTEAQREMKKLAAPTASTATRLPVVPAALAAPNSSVSLPPFNSESNVEPGSIKPPANTNFPTATGR